MKTSRWSAVFKGRWGFKHRRVSVFLELLKMAVSKVSGFRVALDLESFFEDKRRKSYHYIDLSRCKVVRDIFGSIQTIFGINTDISLEINGCFVPEHEDIRVLCNEDVIKVTNDNSSSYSSETSKKSKKRKIAVNNAKHIILDTGNHQTLSSEVQKENENSQLRASTPKKRKKNKSTIIKEDSKSYEESIEESGKDHEKRRNFPQINKSNQMYCEEYTEIKESNKSNGVNLFNSGSKKEISDKCGDTINTNSSKTENGETYSKRMCYSDNSSHLQSQKLNPDLCVTETNNIITGVDSTLKPERNGIQPEKVDGVLNNMMCKKIDSCSIKKRRRRQKNKTNKKTIQGIDFQAGDSGFLQPFNTMSVCMNKTQKTPKHIKFEEDDDDHEDNNVSYEQSNLNDSSSCDNVVTPLTSQTEWSTREGNADCTENKNKFTSKSSVSSSVTTNTNSICRNLISEKHSSPIIFECKRNHNLSNNQEQKEFVTDFSKYPILSTCPRINDIIAFKKLKMDDNYCPVLSEYISSKVVQVSENKETVTLRILNGHDEFKEPQGKFSLEEENEDENSEKPKETFTFVNDVDLNFADLVDVRLLFP